MKIVIYTKSNCPNCTTAKQLLKSKGLEYIEWDVKTEVERDLFSTFIQRHGSSPTSSSTASVSAVWQGCKRL